MEMLRRSIKRHEGFSLVPYLDTEGNYTIGYGRKLKEKCAPIRVHEAEEFLTEDIYHASDNLMRWRFNHKVSLSIARSRALIELIFWVGYTGFLRFAKMGEALEKRDFHLAALELYNSDIGKKHSKRTRQLAEILWG